MSFFPAAAGFIVGLGNCACYLFVAIKAFLGAYGVGSVVQYISVLTRLGDGIRDFMFMVSDNELYCTHLKKMYDYLDIPNHMYQGSLTVEKREDNEYYIEFRNVSFKYPDGDDYVLKNISFTAHQGETVAIIGSTGSGKTTMINLIPRFYDATEGTILVDGVDVKDYNQEFLHNKLGYVPQKAVMFSGSVNYNVAYGDNGKGEISEDTIKKAVEIAQAEEFVEKMPEKYEAHVAQGGTNLSGGQKQRLAIARAIARNPEIYIFDDSFSALDYKTDYTLREELRNYTKDSTNIIVAQRIGTILNADKIIVLENGECVGMGTHKELLNNCKVYQEIAYSQLSKEELENG
jgi:ATP-binding cassette subfamily B multidrug efflux pump